MPPSPHSPSLQDAALRWGHWCYGWGLLLIWLSTELFAGSSYQIAEVHLKGLNRTNPRWLLDYLGLNCPCLLPSEDLDGLRRKLLTTQVFQEVVLQVVPAQHSPTAFDLNIEVKEKWTTIPVVRGAFGGGTPLFVAGIFDTHTFGSLWTLGAESRTYGSAPTGGVMWIRAPRWLEGHHYLNFELWRDNRVRSVYDRRDEEVARIYGSAGAALAEALIPLGQDPNSPWQTGLRLYYRQQEILRREKANAELALEDFVLIPIIQKRLLARLVYDDMAVLQQNLQGLRFYLNAGPVWSGKNFQRSLEQELFWYGLWEQDWNLALHEWLGLSDDPSYQSLYFLGGFDSVRGLPDGVMYGNKAFYTNFELRKIFYRTNFAWWQGAIFADYGSAAFSTSQWFGHDRKSLGFGVRVAIPQVNRLAFRFDYAWSVDQPKSSSLSFGMNQFIDPYRPL